MTKGKIGFLCVLALAIAGWTGCSSPPGGGNNDLQLFCSGNTGGNLKPCG